jgi:uncharacterized membrane protein
MMVYIPLDGWTLAVLLGFSLLAAWIKEWKGLTIMWGAFILAAIVHQLTK